MNFNREQVFRVGIDRIVLTNIELVNPPTAAISFEGEDFIGEKLKVEEELFTLEKTTKLKNDGKYTEWTTLALNPNKILTGSNIINSRTKELKEALEIVLDKLARKNIIVDIARATISEIELNINLNVSFGDYLPALSLLFLNLPKVRKISNKQQTLIYNQLFKASTLDGGWKNHGVRAYDKVEELKKESLFNNYQADIPDIDILRVEWWLLSSSYHYYTDKLGKDNTLECLLDNESIIDEIFKELSTTKLFTEAYEILERKLIPKLEIEYLAFKESARLARSRGRKVPRDVYKYLIDNHWVFDYSDLIELIKKHDKKHKGREIERIMSNYSHLDNKAKLSYLVGNIYPH